MGEPIKSRRGVYYDLSKSPYEYKSPYGDLFKFSSQKKLDMYRRDVPKEIAKIRKLIDRQGIKAHLPKQIIDLIIRTVYKSFYEKIER